MKFRNIEIFEKTNNKKGDLFCRLMADFFHAIGYSEPRFDVHKSGREIDIVTTHRTEAKIAFAECKAHKAKIGGSDINKFVGAFDAEKRKLIKSNKSLEQEAVAYFISISGFRETAIEQEKDLQEQRLILIDKNKIIEELIAGKILVSYEKAISTLQFTVSTPELLDYVDLIAHASGWIWVFYYGLNNQPTHFSFVHAEGKPLIKTLSKELIDFDKNKDQKLQKLTYLKPTNISDTKENLNLAKQYYFEYLKHECGNIQFEGLPTDKDAGSFKVKLENIFQPLFLEKIKPNKERKNELQDITKNRTPIGDILKERITRLAILAKPGGGKSTLLKRIAIAYAFPERINLVNDNLPKYNRFPIFIRCRELGDLVIKSITEIIENIPIRAEISKFKKGFTENVSNALQNGTALLLIDGLDEISDDSHRIQFVNQLRTFLATYPNIHIITTSREAGFRVIGGVLANYCEHYKISNLIANEIKELTIKWHKAIINDTEKIENEAKDLANFILQDPRIRVLAENPLLLTTLLFVKRWAGYLPTKKSVLYQEMIKLLLVTWNVEGHEQLDIDEAEPQLAYLAYWMTKKGQQTITLEDLKICLTRARKEMPDILGYTNISIPNFIKRVESRSSLLILSGHKRLPSGHISPIYEFLHLSFQEYLTAKAIVEKFLDKELSSKSNLDIIKPHIEKDNWKEVVPLVAVLSKRGTNELIEFLIEESKEYSELQNDTFNYEDGTNPPELLGNCIANEIQINPKLLKNAIEWLAKNRYYIKRLDLFEVIHKSKFSTTFYETVSELFFMKYEDKYISGLGGLLGELYFMRITSSNEIETLKQLRINVLSDDKNNTCLGLLGLMIYAFKVSSFSHEHKITQKYINSINDKLLSCLNSTDNHISLAACWCIAWLGEKGIFFTSTLQKFTKTLFIKWISSKHKNMSRKSAWALYSIIDLNSDLSFLYFEIKKFKHLLITLHLDPLHKYNYFMGFFFGSLIGIEFSKSDIEASLNLVRKQFYTKDKFFKISKVLGVEIEDEFDYDLVD